MGEHRRVVSFHLITISRSLKTRACTDFRARFSNKGENNKHVRRRNVGRNGWKGPRGGNHGSRRPGDHGSPVQSRPDSRRRRRESYCRSVSRLIFRQKKSSGKSWMGGIGKASSSCF